MHKVGIVVYNGVDEVEVFGPFDVLSSVKRMEHGHWTDENAFQVQTISDRTTPVVSSHGLPIIPHSIFMQALNLDVIIVPGGPGARLQRYPEYLMDWLAKNAHNAKIVVSLSTGAFILARAGLLRQRRIATYPAFAPDIRRIEPNAKVVTHERVVMDGGNLISTSGISQAFDASLAVIEKLEGGRSADIALRRIGWPMPLDEIVPVYSS